MPSQTPLDIEFFEDALQWLSRLESRAKVPLLGWKLTIKSLLLLREDLLESYKTKFLYTSRLNQDCIENLFSTIRWKGGHGDNPSPREFRQHLRQVMVDSLLVQSKSSNCQEDGDPNVGEGKRERGGDSYKNKETPRTNW
nr:hypothetical protein BaRGS_019439 [Batillaria attramentaria]